MMNMIECVKEAYGRECSFVKEFPAGNYGETHEVLLGNESCVLKIVPSEAEFRLKNVLPLFHFINKKQLCVPHPLVTKQGEFYISCIHRDKNSLMYLYPMLPGVNAEEEIIHSKDKFRALGKAVASLHNIMGEYQKDEIKSIKSWRESESLFIILSDTSSFKDIEEVYNRNFSKLPQVSENRIIHCDLHLANVLYEKESGIFNFIDLEECALGNPLMDLAILLFDIPVLCSSKDVVFNSVQELLRGYHSVSPVKEGELSLLPVYLKLLECASYINFYEYRNSDDPWLKSFYPERKSSILMEKPYLDFDITKLLM